MPDKDWSTTILLTMELIKYSTTYNMAIFAAIAWLFINWKKQTLATCSQCNVIQKATFGVTYLVTTLSAYFHFKLFQEIIAVSSTIKSMQNPVSETIKGYQTNILWSLLVATTLVFILAILKGTGSNAK